MYIVFESRLDECAEINKIFRSEQLAMNYKENLEDEYENHRGLVFQVEEYDVV